MISTSTTSLIYQRYRDPALASLAVSSPVIDSLLSHRSVRDYLDQPLATGTLEAIVAAAQSAATSSNMQSWSVVAVTDQARKDRLAALASNQAHIRQAPLFLVWLADLSRPTRVAAGLGQILENTDYLESFLSAAIDTALAAQNAVVAAESLGLGTVYIGAIRNKPVEVAAELKLPPRVFATFGLCIGHPVPSKPASIKPRLPQSVVLHLEEYSTAGEAAGLAAFEERIKAFQHEQQMPPAGWIVRVLDRYARVASLGGRDRMRETMAAMGFELK